MQYINICQKGKTKSSPQVKGNFLRLALAQLLFFDAHTSSPWFAPTDTPCTWYTWYTEGLAKLPNGVEVHVKQNGEEATLRWRVLG